MPKQITDCPLCNTELELQQTDKGNFYYHCKKCNIGGKGQTEEEAKKDILNASIKINKTLAIPQNINQVQIWASQNINALMESSAQFIDKPETKRMIQKNVNYIANADFKKAWDTDEGRMSIVEAFTEALYYGCILGEMGDIVPFGQVVEFIPGMPTFEFALTSGKSAPLRNITIDCVYENDQYEASREDGNFHFKFINIGLPRGEIIGIVVQAYDVERQASIGEIYDEQRLMKKAEQHSIAYKYYLKDLQALRVAQTEQKDYIEKWGKKYYEKDITNPYANADKPEMLKKVAGKSYFRPYMKIRNARAVVKEYQQQGNIKDAEDIYEKTIDESIAVIKDAEFNIDESEKNSNEEKDLFGEDVK